MSRIRLIDKPECPFCWRVRIAAAMQGRVMHSMDRSDPDVLAEWQRLSPSQTVPVLIEDDLVLTDSGPMLEYLAETGPALLPDSPRRRAEARSWVVYGDRILGQSLREVVFEKRDKPENEWDQDRIRKGTHGFLAISMCNTSSTISTISSTAKPTERPFSVNTNTGCGVFSLNDGAPPA